MSAPPLGELYDLLRADGLVIGVDDHVRLGRLLARDATWTIDQLRAAVAALVITDPRERTAFDACWTRWLGGGQAATPTPVVPKKKSPPPAGISPLLVVVAPVLVVAVVVLVAGLKHQFDEDEPPPDAPAAPITESYGGTAPAPSPSPPPAPAVEKSLARPIGFGTFAIGAFVLAVVAIARAGAHARRKRFVPGPWTYRLAVPPATAPVLSRLSIEDGAADLTWQAHEPGRELDLPRTVDATIEHGGLATFAYRRPPAASRYLVLEDLASGAERWRFLYDELLRGLAREGVELERHTFVGNPEQCTGPDGKPRALRELFEHADAVIAIGDADDALDPLTGELADWVSALRDVAHRLWINPMPPSRWSAGARAIAAETPMEHGVAHALAALHAGIDRHDRPEHAYPAVIDRAPGSASAVAALRGFLGEPAFQLLAALATVGPPTIHTARWLAEQHPGIGARLDEQAWLHLVSLPWFRTRTWPVELRARLCAALDPALARAIGDTADTLLAASEPAAASSAHLQWELDRASRTAARGDREAAHRELVRVAQTPLAHAARERLAALKLPDVAHRRLATAAILGVLAVVGGGGAYLAGVWLESPPAEVAAIAIATDAPLAMDAATVADSPLAEAGVVLDGAVVRAAVDARVARDAAIAIDAAEPADAHVVRTSIYASVGPMTSKVTTADSAMLVATMRTVIVRELGAAGVSLQGTPTRAALATTNTAGFFIDGTLVELETTGSDDQTKVRCKINLLVADYPSKDVFGLLNGGATVATKAAEVPTAAADCVTAVVEDLIKNKVIPTMRQKL